MMTNKARAQKHRIAFFAALYSATSFLLLNAWLISSQIIQY